MFFLISRECGREREGLGLALTPMRGHGFVFARARERGGLSRKILHVAALDRGLTSYRFRQIALPVTFVLCARAESPKGFPFDRGRDSCISATADGNGRRVLPFRLGEKQYRPGTFAVRTLEHSPLLHWDCKAHERRNKYTTREWLSFASERIGTVHHVRAKEYVVDCLP
jgi:hypothetical protein